MTEKLIAIGLSLAVIGCPLFGFAGVCGVAGSCCAPIEPDPSDGCGCCAPKHESSDEDPRPSRPAKVPVDSPCQCFCGGAVVVGKPADDDCLASPASLGQILAPVQTPTGADADWASSLLPARSSRATPGRVVRCLLMSLLC